MNPYTSAPQNPLYFSLFILHISTNLNKSLPVAHFVAMCDYKSSHRVDFHTV